MFVVIAGGGRTATHLAGLLVNQNHQIHVVEHRREVLAHLHTELPTEVIFEGHALDPQVIEQAGIRDAQVLAACTPVDADNLMLCFIARTRYGVPRTIAWINNPRTAWLFDEKFHIDVAVNQAEIMAGLIEEEMSLGDMMVLLKLHRGQFSLVEEKIPPSSPVVGMALKDLILPPNTVIATIIRLGEMVIPRGDTEFRAEDEVLAITDPAGAERLAVLFGPSRI